VLHLRIESCPPDQIGLGLTFLDPKAMEEEGIVPGDVIEVTTGFGKSVLARVAPPLERDRGQSQIRLDHYLTQSVKALIGDVVEVEKTVAPPLDKIVLAPLMDVSLVEDADKYLQSFFGSMSMPVASRTILFCRLPGSTTGTTIKVVDLSPRQGVITKDTVVDVRPIFTTWPGSTMTEVTFEDVGGLKKEIRMVRELVELPLRFPDAFRRLGINPPRGIIFYGPPGSGKTHLARALANEMKAEFFYVNGPEVIGTHYGETESNLRKIFQDASQHLPSIIMVDEVDVIGIKRGQSGAFSDTRMATQFLELMDGLSKVEGVMVVGTTNRIETVDPALRRPGRFDREIFVGPPDMEGRLEILKIHTRGMPLSQEARDNLPEVARDTHGFVGADIMELCREAGLNALRRHIGERWAFLSHLDIALDDLGVVREDFLHALGRIRPSALREALTTVPEVRWKDVGGLDEVKLRLRELVEKPLLQPEVFASMNLKPPAGILLHGPPGTGKTLLGQAIANECRANFVSVKGPEIFSKWVGESEEAIRQIFRVARQASPTVVFFDQLEAIAPKRMGGDTGSRAPERVVSQLLTELDGIEPLSGIVVLAATNRFDLLDPAVLRPGRFGVHLHVPLPDEAGRKDILRIHLEGVPLDSGVNLERVTADLAARTEGFAGAELVTICQEARLTALRSAGFGKAAPVRNSDLLAALEMVLASRKFYQEETAVAR